MLATHHFFSRCSSELHDSSNSKIDFSLSIRQVLSANRRGLLKVALYRSFMYIKKSRGPSVEPWGTPIDIGLKEEEQLLQRQIDCVIRDNFQSKRMQVLVCCNVEVYLAEFYETQYRMLFECP